MSIFHVIILAIVQGLAELLPVSSSAHVVVAEKLLGLDPTTPQMTLLLVMLHTGTMFAVIVYFWNQWKKTYFSSGDAFKRFLIRLVWASLLTAVIGEIIVKTIEKTAFKGASKGEIELLFGRLDLIAPALFAAGLLILLAGLMEKRRMGAHEQVYGDSVTMRQAGWIGAIQGLCLPFRGFSRSGATISTGMLAGASKERAERFSFALAVVLTPPAVGREVTRLMKASHEATAAGVPIDLHGSMVMGLHGAGFAVLAGLLALRWLSSWLEEGRWYVFGLYHAGY
jgi:undecaprenyl-diphosphatase